MYKKCIEICRLCDRHVKKGFLCDGRFIALSTSIYFMCQNTPLAANLPDVRPSASLTPEGSIKNGEKNQKSPRLLDQSHRVDFSMRTKRPMTHSFVRSVAFSVPLGNIPGAGPLHANLNCFTLYKFAWKGYL